MDLIYVILIVSAIIVSIPWIYGLLLPIIKPALSGKGLTYLYAFSSGFFIILAIFGFYSESKEDIVVYLEANNYSQGAIWGISIGIMGGASLSVLGLSILFKYLVAKKLTKKDDHSLQESHDHSHMIFNINDINPKSKILALFLLLSHRIPGGLIIGFLIANIQHDGGVSLTNILFLVTFALHIIPEELILYYRQREAGIKKWNAARNSFIGTSLLIPFIFIGAYTSTTLGENVILLSFLKVCVGSVILFSALIEFIPELLHKKLTAKQWYIIIIFIIVGIVSGLILFSIHTHGGEHDHVDDHIETFYNIIYSIK